MRDTSFHFAFAVASLVAASTLFLFTPGARANDDREPTEATSLSVRAVVSDVQLGDGDHAVIGGAATLFVPFGELPLGFDLTGGAGHGWDGVSAATFDASLRVRLDGNGYEGHHVLVPHLRLGPTLALVSRDGQGMSVTAGGVLGLGLTVWVDPSVGLVVDGAYRITGGEELRLIGELGVGASFAL